MTLPAKLAKRIAGTCCYGGCADDALDGSDYCGPHDAHERARDAGKKRRRRQRLAKAGLCAAGCGKKVGKRHGRKPRECKACRAAHVERMRKRRATACVPGGDGAVPGDTDDKHWRPDPNRDGDLNWNRYRGKGKRGRLSREEQLDELVRDAAFALDKLKDCMRAINVLKTPDVQELPPIQRSAAYREVADLAAQAGRLADSVTDALNEMG